ncbi:ras association domain-containing protein 10 [Astyanax mexicanus]|uniref:ras association domain-containing protein 10 n=1 Tax=Astyanax mexicanus TaxID=7994 RepID=UPI0020CB68DA|nr:ras association domain-containing protein 10 [Astyanax mexicanus]
MERAEDCKVSVWVCREEKLVSGLSRRTTCADVVRALLEEQRSAAPPRSYCIVEKWRGYERALPARTRLLRLWTAWGREREHVRFVLVRSDASVPSGGARSAEARVVSSAESRERALEMLSTPAPPTCSRERQRRVVRKAFRKLERMKQNRGGGDEGGEEEDEEGDEDGDIEGRKKGNRHASRVGAVLSSSADKMETLVHLVVSQDHTIRQQLERIRELDGEIDRFEAKVHLDRVQRHGVNYVQDTYLAECSPERDEESAAEAQEEEEEKVERFEEYTERWDEVIKLQEELAEREALLEQITGEIEEELNHRWMRRRREELKEPKDKQTTDMSEETPASLSVGTVVPQEVKVETLSDSEVQLEEERIKTQLDTSLYIGLRLNTDLESVKSDLDLSSELWEAKDKELRDLLEKVDFLNKGDEDEDTVDTEFSPVVQPVAEKSAGWVEEARGLSKSRGGGNDDDSDTGLSSMHSQDSDNPPVCESLV